MRRDVKIGGFGDEISSSGRRCAQGSVSLSELKSGWFCLEQELERKCRMSDMEERFTLDIVLAIIAHVIAWSSLQNDVKRREALVQGLTTAHRAHLNAPSPSDMS